MTLQRTFDQLLAEKSVDPLTSPNEFSPNAVIESRVVLEPLPEQNRVRVTARTADYRLLWGVIASKGVISQHPVPVAVYDALTELVKEKMPEVAGRDLTETVVADARGAAIALVRSVEELAEKLYVKKVSDATRIRAALYCAAFRDAKKLIETYITECET